MKDVASHTATDIQELLAGEPKEIMMSLDQKVAAAACTSAESEASQKQSHTTSIEEIGKGGVEEVQIGGQSYQYHVKPRQWQP